MGIKTFVSKKVTNLVTAVETALSHINI